MVSVLLESLILDVFSYQLCWHNWLVLTMYPLPVLWHLQWRHLTSDLAHKHYPEIYSNSLTQVFEIKEQ